MKNRHPRLTVRIRHYDQRPWLFISVYMNLGGDGDGSLVETQILGAYPNDTCRSVAESRLMNAVNPVERTISLLRPTVGLVQTRWIICEEVVSEAPFSLTRLPNGVLDRVLEELSAASSRRAA